MQRKSTLVPARTRAVKTLALDYLSSEKGNCSHLKLTKRCTQEPTRILFRNDIERLKHPDWATEQSPESMRSLQLAGVAAVHQAHCLPDREAPWLATREHRRASRSG